MTKYLSILNKTKLLNLIGGLFLLIGLVILIPVLYFHLTNTGTAEASPLNPSQVWTQQNAIENASNNKNLLTGFPVSISIPGPRPALNMNVSIIPGYYIKTSKTWTLSDSAAMFATSTSQPNNLTGNTFIYGHYRPNVFAYLHLITPGTVATVTTNNGYVFSYKFVKTYAVQPQDTSVLSFSVSPILTVQTCSGTFFQNRQMYIFSYVSYKKV